MKPVKIQKWHCRLGKFKHLYQIGYIYFITIFTLVMLAIVIGWMSVNDDDETDYLLVGQVETKKRYHLISILAGLEIRLMSLPMRGQYLLKNSLNGKGSRSTANTFRVTVIVTLNSVSGGFHEVVSAIDTYYSYYRNSHYSSTFTFRLIAIDIELYLIFRMGWSN